MAVPATYSYQTGNANRRTVIKEDVSDVIHNISPSETPMLSAAKTKTARGAVHEWLEDTLASPGANAVAEGADAAITDMGTGTRLVNSTQISSKAYGVSGTFEAIDSYGFSSAIAYAGAKAARVLKNDVDYAISGGGTQTRTITASGVATKTGDIDTYVTQGTFGATTGAAGDGLGTTAATAGDATTFSQALLDQAIEECWEAGGKPSLLVTNANNRKIFSSFDGVGTAGASGVTRSDRSSKTIWGVADVYMSNFGELNVVASRHLRANASIWLIDPEYLAVAYLRPWQESDLAKTGDSLNRQMVVEYALEVSNRSAHSGIHDCTN